MLIEDAAQALGGVLPCGEPVGSAGDVSVFSFSRTKIIETGGGALLVRAPEHTVELRRILDEHPLPQPPDAQTRKLLSLSYRDVHHGLVALFRSGSRLERPALFLELQPHYFSLYLQPLESPEPLSAVWPRLNALLEARYAKAELYSQRLAGGPWLPLDAWRDSGVCWRYSLLLQNANWAQPLSDAVRSDGFHVSNLYWALNHLFKPDDLCPNAVSFAERVVNLWVDPSVDAGWVERCTDSLWTNADALKEQS